LAAAALRELDEEANLNGEITRLLGVFDSRRWVSALKFHVYHTIFLVSAPDGPPSASPPESTGVGFFAEDRLPPLSPGHDLRVPLIFKLVRGEITAPYFDPEVRGGG
jgi:ADP-ribose pyrophosphatase YjhB (NUDIX family)